MTALGCRLSLHSAIEVILVNLFGVSPTELRDITSNEMIQSPYRYAIDTGVSFKCLSFKYP